MWFERWAAEYHVPTSLLQALAWDMSSWDNTSVNGDGDMGIGRIDLELVGWINEELIAGRDPVDPRSPEGNIQLMAAYLGHLLEITGGDHANAVATYFLDRTEPSDATWELGLRSFVTSVLSRVPDFEAPTAPGGDHDDDDHDRRRLSSHCRHVPRGRGARARDYVAPWRGHRSAGNMKVTRGEHVRIYRKLRALLGLLMAFTLLAAACGDDSGDDTSSDTTAADGSTETTEGGETSDLTVGLAYDLGGRGDQSFNDSAAAGLDQAAEEFGIETEELEPNEGGENRAGAAAAPLRQRHQPDHRRRLPLLRVGRRRGRELPGQHVRRSSTTPPTTCPTWPTWSSPRSRARSWSARPRRSRPRPTTSASSVAWTSS